MISNQETNTLIAGGWWDSIDSCNFEKGVSNEFKDFSGDNCMHFSLAHTIVIKQTINLCFDDVLRF